MSDTENRKKKIQFSYISKCRAKQNSEKRHFIGANTQEGKITGVTLSLEI